MTDYLHKIVEALEIAKVSLEPRLAEIIQKALPLAREAVAKAEALDWLLENSNKHWDFKNSQRLLVDCTDCPEIIRKMLEEKK